MNDLFIIIVCIILLLIVWGVYFKYIREGMDPNSANYTMPISFSGEKDNKNEKIKVPQFIETNNGEPITLVNDTNVAGVTNLKDTNVAGVTNLKDTNVTGVTNLKDTNVAGHLNMTEKMFVTFGKGDAISANNKWGGERNELEIVGVGNCDNGCNRYIHMWDDVVVERNLNVKNGDITIQNGHWLQMKGGGINTEGINIKNKQYIGGMQFGLCDGKHHIDSTVKGWYLGQIRFIKNDYGWCKFNQPFNTDSVYVFTNHNRFSNNNADGSVNSYYLNDRLDCSRVSQTTSVWGQNRNGFYYRSVGITERVESGFECGQYPFFWFAISG